MPLPAEQSIELVLVRHGETTWNAAARVQGQNDESVLTEKGRAQAMALVEVLGHLDVAAIWSSDLGRARATAAPLADALRLTVSEHAGLRERDFGVLEGGPVAALSPEVTGVRDGVVFDPDAAPSSGESIRAFSHRVEQAIEEIAGQLVALRAPQRVVLVVHGGTIRIAEGLLSGLPLERLAWGPVENAAVVEHHFVPKLMEECG